jgi:hypothetical protein
MPREVWGTLDERKHTKLSGKLLRVASRLLTTSVPSSLKWKARLRTRRTPETLLV